MVSNKQREPVRGEKVKREKERGSKGEEGPLPSLWFVLLLAVPVGSDGVDVLPSQLPPPEGELFPFPPLLSPLFLLPLTSLPSFPF